MKHFITKTFKKPKEKKKQSYFDRNQGAIQFWMLIATFTAVFTSIYFSYKNLEFTANQIRKSDSVFRYTVLQDSTRRISDSITEDHIRKFNDKQLTTADRQNKFIEQQLTNQTSALKLKNEIEKPSLAYQNVQFFAHANNNAILVVNFKNSGQRIAHLIKVVSIKYNPQSKKHYCRANTDKFDLIYNGTYALGEYGNQLFFEDPETIFFVRIFYRDLGSNVYKKDFYFQLTSFPNNEIKILPGTDDNIKAIDNFITSRIIDHQKFMDDINVEGAAKIKP